MSSPSSASGSDEFDVVILGGGAGAKKIWGSVGERAVAVVEQLRVGTERRPAIRYGRRMTGPAWTRRYRSTYEHAKQPNRTTGDDGDPPSTDAPAKRLAATTLWLQSVWAASTCGG
jgi:hypothetical protein